MPTTGFQPSAVSHSLEKLEAQISGMIRSKPHSSNRPLAPVCSHSSCLSDSAQDSMETNTTEYSYGYPTLDFMEPNTTEYSYGCATLDPANQWVTLLTHLG